MNFKEIDRAISKVAKESKNSTLQKKSLCKVALLHTNFIKYATNEDHSYGHVGIYLDEDLSELIKEWRDDFLPPEYVVDYEDNFHITALYGIHSNDPSIVEDVIKKYPRNFIYATLGEVSVFEQEDKDTLVIKVYSKDLKNLNNILVKNLKYTSTYKEYNPHLTLAYLKKGTYKKLEYNNLYNQTIEFDRVSFNSANNKTRIFSLGKEEELKINEIDAGSEVSEFNPEYTGTVPQRDDFKVNIVIGPETDEDDYNTKEVDLEVYMNLVEADVAIEKTAACVSLIKEGSVKATAGQILMNEMLPPAIRDYSRIIDKRSIKTLMQQVADKYPEHYANINYGIRRFSDAEGLYAMKHLRYDDLDPPVKVKGYLEEAKKKYERLYKKYKNKDMALTEAYGSVKSKLDKDVLSFGVKKNNVFALMAFSGAKGKPAQVTDTLVSPLLVTDFKNKPIPIIIDKSYSQGLTPAQYWAASYGTRRGMISTKLAVPLAGYTSKMLGWSIGNVLVIDDDCGTDNGVSYATSDSSNLGKVLAKKAGIYNAGTIISNKILSDLKHSKIDKIILRSPLTCESENGVCSKCTGKTEAGALPAIGYNIGINASAALSEPLSQGMLSEKHTGGAIKKRIGGFPLISKLIEVPSKFPDKAILAQEHSKIKSVIRAPWGGYHIETDDNKYYTQEQNPPVVKVGNVIEKGEVLSEGIINPAEKTMLRGTGEGRKQLAESLKAAYDEMGTGIDRIHFEVAARAFVNFGKVLGDKPVGMNLPGDVVNVDSLMKHIKFDDAATKDVDKTSNGEYLAKSVLHYTPGTELTHKVRKDILSNNIKRVLYTKKKLPFMPLMVRVQDTAATSKDWVARLASQGLKKGILEAVHKGLVSKTTGKNFVHPYIHGTTFGKKFY